MRATPACQQLGGKRTTAVVARTSKLDEPVTSRPAITDDTEIISTTKRHRDYREDCALKLSCFCDCPQPGDH
jgi:hypothetical protein